MIAVSHPVQSFDTFEHHQSPTPRCYSCSGARLPETTTAAAAPGAAQTIDGGDEQGGGGGGAGVADGAAGAGAPGLLRAQADDVPARRGVPGGRGRQGGPGHRRVLGHRRAPGVRVRPEGRAPGAGGEAGGEPPRGGRPGPVGAPGVLVLPADVSRPDDCRKFVDDTIRYFGRLDHLVNNASIWQVCKFEEVDDVNHFRKLMDINFWGHVYPTQFAIPHLKRSQGRIVGVTSNSSYIFIGRNTFYNASKAAALSFYDTLRLELGGAVRITEVVPGVVESEITKGKMLTKEGEMKVDQDERDVCVRHAILGPTPAERTGDFARTVVRDVCRGARYVFEPRWYAGVYLLRVCLPELLAWTSRLLTVRSLGADTADTLGKRLVDLPGVRPAVQPPSLRSPEIKEH